MTPLDGIRHVSTRCARSLHTEKFFKEAIFFSSYQTSESAFPDYRKRNDIMRMKMVQSDDADAAQECFLPRSMFLNIAVTSMKSF